MFLFMSSLDTGLWKQELMLMKQETKYSKGHWPPSSESCFLAPVCCILVSPDWGSLEGGVWYYQLPLGPVTLLSSASF